MKVRTWGALVRIPVVYDLKMLLGRDMLFLEKSQVVYFECFFFSKLSLFYGSSGQLSMGEAQSSGVAQDKSLQGNIF